MPAPVYGRVGGGVQYRQGLESTDGAP